MFSFCKVVANLPSTLEPNAIYAVRVGAGFDLYVSDMTGAVAHKLNGASKALATVEDLAYWRETMDNRQRLYVQSRGQGLISNGYGLMQDNTNFSGFVFDATDTHTGFGCFKTDAVNFNRSIDEFIAINPNSTYEFSFFAKTLTQGANNLAYAFVECFDIDKQSIQPHHLPIIAFRVTQDVSYDHSTISIHPEDRAAFNTLYQRYRMSTANFLLSSHEYTAATGFKYPNGTYTRHHHSNHTPWNKTLYNPDTGVWGGVAIKRGEIIAAGSYVTVTIPGGSYLYLFAKSLVQAGQVGEINRELANHSIPAEWTQYKARFVANKVLRAGTAMVKVGWLLNRGSTGGNATGVCAVEFREVG